ncbi:MAG TPA: ATP-binding protein [Xanthobacteraceae bacterium]|nr:ATP-binding protein [Xanthobacteraceae bacterium]
MRQSRSIRFHLSAVFFFFFLLVVVLGLFSIMRLSDYDKVASDVVDLWLPNTRVLGDLNNFTSDFRAAEGTSLLSRGAAERTAAEREMAELDRSIGEAEESYEKIRHDDAEIALYARFKAQWGDYRREVDQVLALAHADRGADAVATSMTTSRAAYNQASDTLGQLTDRNVANAQTASSRTASVYWESIKLIGIAIAIAGVMVAAALVYIGNWISSPLLHLAERMHRLARNDTDIDVRGTERSDEIGEMARAAVVFRDNAMELMVSRRGLAQQASMLEEKLEAERRLTLLQRNFVSMASHEFRTPLTIIDGHAQRLIKARQRGDDAAERAGKIRAAVLRMTHLIDNLLNTARLLDGAGLYFHPAAIDMAAVLQEVCQMHREIAPKANLVEALGSPALPMSGDRNLLSQAVSNLISNAIKYSPGNAPITIEARADGDDVIVSVADRGIGIPQSDIGRLFERYYRGRNVSGVVGTGVGLYLVKIVVDLHGGSIAVESREGEGSRFTLRLPAHGGAAAAEPARAEALS